MSFRKFYIYQTLNHRLYRNRYALSRRHRVSTNGRVTLIVLDSRLEDPAVFKGEGKGTALLIPICLELDGELPSKLRMPFE